MMKRYFLLGFIGAFCWNLLAIKSFYAMDKSLPDEVNVYLCLGGFIYAVIAGWHTAKAIELAVG